MEQTPYHHSNEFGTKKSLREMIQATSKPDFKQVLSDLQGIKVEELLHDRVAQARLDVLLHVYSERSSRGENPETVVLWRRDKDGAVTGRDDKRNRFQLADGEYFYYFNEAFPSNSEHLRPEDIVAEEDYADYRVVVSSPFTKPLNRVPISGGIAEVYNYNSEAWEENGDGEKIGKDTWNRRSLKNNQL